MDRQFQTGETVTLKSGGPFMTVRYAVDAKASSATGEAIGIHCDWLDKNGVPHTAAYQQDQLTSAYT